MVEPVFHRMRKKPWTGARMTRVFASEGIAQDNHGAVEALRVARACATGSEGVGANPERRKKRMRLSARAGSAEAATVARSFKFQRPRGIYFCGIEKPNAIPQFGAGHCRNGVVRLSEEYHVV
jgi:hypothetical protein